MESVGRRPFLWAEPRGCANLLACEGSGLAVCPETNTFPKVCAFEPGGDLGVNAGMWAEVGVCVSVPQTGVRGACLLRRWHTCVLVPVVSFSPLKYGS